MGGSKYPGFIIGSCVDLHGSIPLENIKHILKQGKLWVSSQFRLKKIQL